jgi:hypothetical protein
MISAATLALLWQPFFSPAATLTCVAIVLALTVWSYARSARHRPVLGGAMLGMRCVLIVLIGLLLMGPSAIRPGTSSLRRPTLRVLLDTSASMQTPDADGMTRYDFARDRWLTPKRLAALRDVYDVELFAFDESLRVIGGAAPLRSGKDAVTAGVSNIAKSVSDSLLHGGAHSGADGSALLVLSDGRDTLDAPMHPVGQLARARSIPIYTVPLGGPSMSRDLAVIAVPRQPYLFAKEPGSIAVRVMRSNAGQSDAVIHVEQGDRHETFPVNFNGQDTAAIDVPIVHDESGTYAYRVWTDPISDEADITNNSQPVFIEVTARRLRVLLLEGQPYWDTKFLAHALRKDTRIELTQITQVTPDRSETIVSREGAATDTPRTLDQLGRFDVIILGRGIGNVLEEKTASLLPRYVSERGGRLVFARGRAYDPEQPLDDGLQAALSVIEPVIFGRGYLHDQDIELEPAGMMHPGLQDAPDADTFSAPGKDDLPTLLNVPVVVREKAAARVLARARPRGLASGSDAGQPAIVTMPYGQGVVVAVLGEGLWRWSLRPRSGGTGNAAFDRFWMDTVRWLALGSDYQPGKPMSLRLSRLGVQTGDPISLDLVSRTGFDSLDTVVIIEAPGGERETIALSPVEGSTTRQRAVLYPKTPGVYRVFVQSFQPPGQTIEARFNCYDIDIERLHTAANRGALRTLSESSGGRCLNPDEPDDLPKLLTRQREAMQGPPKPYYLWDRGWVMSLVLIWAGAEWIIRRAGGLL